jgi:hypothetical protein
VVPQLPSPSIGRIVLYKLSAGDVANINNVRLAHNLMGATLAGGEVVPAVIVKTWNDPAVPAHPYTAVNLRLFVDGEDTPWVTSRHRGQAEFSEGSYAWPTFDYQVKESE